LSLLAAAPPNAAPSTPAPAQSAIGKIARCSDIIRQLFHLPRTAAELELSRLFGVVNVAGFDTQFISNACELTDGDRLKIGIIPAHFDLRLWVSSLKIN